MIGYIIIKYRLKNMSKEKENKSITTQDEYISEQIKGTKKLIKKHQFGGGIGAFPGLRFMNWLFSPKKETAERVMHTSASPGVAASGLILNPFNEKNYTGSYKYNHNTSEKGINFVSKNPFADNNTFKDRDHVKLFLYGDEQGFEKSDEPEIVVNDEKWTSKQYKGKMMPMDTLYLSNRMRPFIQKLIKRKQIINFDENNKLSDGNKYQKYDGVMMDNVASYNGRFSNKGKQHYLSNFDLIDYEPEQFSKNWGNTTKFLASLVQKAGEPTKKYPNAGPFVLRQDRIPIVYTNGNNDDDYLLQKLNIKGGNDATKQFHQDYWNSVFNVE